MVKVGRTIAQEWERQESESDRLAARKKQKNKKIISVCSYLALLGVLAMVAVITISNLTKPVEVDEVEASGYAPTVDILDESGAGVTNKMKEYVGKLEADFREFGYTVTRAVIPAGKMREVDIFINGYDYYFKTNIDRGAGVTAEDGARMIKYLEDREIVAQYIDIRVEGKAYYK